MHIMIIGAGSLGLLYAAKLAEVCDSMTVTARTEAQALALQREGIVLDGRPAAAFSPAVRFAAFEEHRLSTGGDAPYDFIFLMVKQSAIEESLLSYMSAKMSRHTVAVCFQNGIGHAEKLEQALGADRVLLAVTTEAAIRDGLHKVNHTGHGVTYIGNAGGSEENKGPEKFRQILLADTLRKAGFDAQVSKDMDTRVWNKLIINCVINPLTAILRVRNGELLESEWTRQLMRELYQEAAGLASAKGIPVSEDLWGTLLQVCEATADNHSSMLQDLMNARRTEIDSMNGSLLGMAREAKMELAAHQTVYRFIKALE